MRARRALPASYAVLALVAVVLVLPTALRPPPDTANQSSQYSPDAPPDKKADALIKSVQLGGGSQTAGQGPVGSEVVKRRATPRATVAATAPPARHASRAGCYPGRPPRQIESVYSPACIPAFLGDNGGATGPQVSATTINVVVDGNTEGEVTQASSRSLYDIGL